MHSHFDCSVRLPSASPSSPLNWLHRRKMGSGHLSFFSIEGVLQLSRLWDLQLETLNCELLGITRVMEKLMVQP